VPRVDSVGAVVAEKRANGVLVRVTFRGAAPKDVRGVLRDSLTVDIPFGRAVLDADAISVDADGLIIEHTILHDSGTVLRLRTAEPLEGITTQRERSRLSIVLRTSRATAVATDKHAAWRMNVVVLDAGHGGSDPGAQGIGGTNEKDVTLAIVLKLGRLLEKARFTVVYTRRTDVFVELYRRAQIANEAKGKLFISVHCNSMPTKPSPANGFESYILRPGKNETAVRVAQRENSAVRLENDQSRYGGMTEEAFIVAAMAQSGFVKYSERFATLVQDEIARHLPGARNNGVNQAGFLVLVGASMPNILIETGYVSNTREERVLASGGGQQRIAEGIAAAVQRFRVAYEKGIAR
jgi:N-acetylmuramoyl-L-alanine amidase